MLKVGLTGSIAVGKSFVCEVFRELGCHVLDADTTARRVVEPGTSGLAEVVKHFGKEMLMPSGELDRSKLGRVVFADQRSRLVLNAIVHPLVIEAQDAWLKECESEDPGGIAIVDAALMIESGGYKRFDKLIVVWCQPAVQLERLIIRNHLSAEEALRRISSQMPQEEKKKFADYLVDTSEGFDETRRQTLEVFEELKMVSNL